MNANQVMEKAQIAISDMADRLERIAAQMRAAGDETMAAKIAQLLDKARTGEMSIAFCGHFSAGKSTMINTLLGKDILPSNPIPTSANVVKIRGGEPAARVYTRNSGVLTFDPDTEMSKLKQYAIDGDTVDWVEISYPGTFLGEQAGLLDTPGIDSTDAAHKIATESALHLADAVVYMMDYNHVQAEENFAFTKMLKDWGKPVYLVINMIDKHLDFELDFDSYKESVVDAFATWNIQPDGIFYTSLAEPDHPENQYEAFYAKLQELIGDREQLIEQSILMSAYQLIEDHQRFLSAQHADKRRALEEKTQVELDDVDASDAQSVASALQEVTARIAKETEQVSKAYKKMESDLTVLLDNARLTYYSTNEAAERYLESRRPNFKVGLLFAGKKTEEEKAAREQALLADLQEKVSANLDFHFKELLTRLPQEYGIRDDAYHQEVHGLKIAITPELLASQVKQGAASREYLLNYCQDISNSIKAAYRRAGLALIERVIKQLEDRLADESAAWRESELKLAAVADAHKELAALQATEEQAADRLRAILVKGE
ncbi:dynamin family protein [Brevibacillus fluminis]|uniref:Dynamin family protein n=1 Tax=Brevibacillus fluminis TaxID=511487 RepID=A0A3M8DGU8_9BACL|nr:dynamin family protein [Brevibacillus fluminis]RNB87303.1 dynamin family protein [Brevibacillus fluminis]